MTRYLLPIGVFASLCAVFAVGLTKDPSRLPSPLIGKSVPAFSLPSLADASTQVSSSDYKGQFYLVNVWASWCFACRDEHDFLLDLARENRLPIVGLNWRDERPNAERWLRDLGDPYTAIAHDLDGRIGIEFGVYGAPETFLVNPAGQIVAKHVSPMTTAVWARDFQPHIDAGQTP